MSLEFHNLPLVEVAVRLFFGRSVQVSLELVSRIHAKLDEYPRLQDLDIIESSPVKQEGPVAVSLPGAKYGGHPSGLEINLQANLVSLWWRRGFGAEYREYPRFDVMETALWHVVERLSSVMSDGMPDVRALNMQYTNFIPMSDVTPEAVLRGYFKEPVWIGLVGGSALVHHLDVSWRSDGVDERLFLRLGESTTEKVRGYLLGTVAGVAVAPPGSAREGLRTVHDRLQVFFESVISDRAKKEWGHVE